MKLPFSWPGRGFAVAILAAIALLGGSIWVGMGWVRGYASAIADAAGEQAVRGHRALLASELQKFRLLPLVLVEYPDVAAALTGDLTARNALNGTLELLASRTDAANLYAIDPTGRTVAASNWREPTSFEGQNYAFRPYFRDAMRSGSAELFALGTVSGRPGLYLARRVDRGTRRLGVVVIKVEFDAVEAAWARMPGASFVTDAAGVILITSLPRWRFRTINEMDPAMLAGARRSRQFGADPPARAPIRMAAADAVATVNGVAQAYRVAVQTAPFAGGQLYHITPLDGPIAAARTQALLWGLGALLVLGIVAGLALRAADTRRLQGQARIALEHEVVRRTRQLSEANARLTIESDERAEADRRYRLAREELAQANRLGTLGQITAGVAHEINQPVAAIRTFAESGAILVERGAMSAARENLGRIVDLADRIGGITAELKGYARKRVAGSDQATLASVLDGVRMLMGERIAAVAMDISPELQGLVLKGERVRIEQILVNLLQNALDAVASAGAGRVRMTVARTGEVALIEISDDGTGVDPAIVDTLFTPFTSATPGGLGLGLAIARNIAREFNGDLRHEQRSRGGATFVLTLPAA